MSKANAATTPLGLGALLFGHTEYPLNFCPGVDWAPSRLGVLQDVSESCSARQCHPAGADGGTSHEVEWTAPAVVAESSGSPGGAWSLARSSLGPAPLGSHSQFCFRLQHRRCLWQPRVYAVSKAQLLSLSDHECHGHVRPRTSTDNFGPWLAATVGRFALSDRMSQSQ